jgi:hypothetical protein
MKNTLAITLSLLLVITISTSALAQAQVKAMKKPGLALKTGYFCRNESVEHPALGRLAEQYEVAYPEVLRWFCEGRFGVGEIMHALQASQALDGAYSPEEILALKVQLGGWGKVWQELGLKGPDKQTGDRPGKGK